MKNKDKYDFDLRRECRLGKFLDEHYPQIEKLQKGKLERIDDITEQHKGIDLIYTHDTTGEKVKIDEKAQLNYIDQYLDTFVFEISYLKKKQWRKGWFYDEKKETEKYFLITCIKSSCENEFEDFRLISIDRKKLQDYLTEKGLSERKIMEYEKMFRADTDKYKGEQSVPELSKELGFFHNSFYNLDEGPVNLKLRLRTLLQKGLAQELKACDHTDRSK
jgi:hypothetical protein